LTLTLLLLLSLLLQLNLQLLLIMPPTALRSSQSLGTGNLDEDDDIVFETAPTTEDATPVAVATMTSKFLAGGEPCLLDREVEEKGIIDVLAALTAEERKQIPHPDMPLRHFRGEKVRAKWNESPIL
jgi:hypothetical protein